MELENTVKKISSYEHKLRLINEEKELLKKKYKKKNTIGDDWSIAVENNLETYYISFYNNMFKSMGFIIFIKDDIVTYGKVDITAPDFHFLNTTQFSERADLVDKYIINLSMMNDMLRDLKLIEIKARKSIQLYLKYGEELSKITKREDEILFEISYYKNILFQTRNKFKYNDEDYWCGIYDIEKNEILECHTFKDAEDADFHIDFYFKESNSKSFDNGKSIFFWVDDKYNINIMNNISLSATLSQNIVDQIKTKIKL